MPSESSFKKCLEASTAALAVLLARSGFSPKWELADRGAYRRCFYRREVWKRDVVEIVYRRGGELSIIVNLLIEVATDDHEWVQVPIVHPITPTIPSFAPEWRVARYASTVSQAVEQSLPLFASLTTPAAVLGHLENVGPAPGMGFTSARTALSNVMRGDA